MTFANDTRELAETYDRASDLQLETGMRLVERLGVGEGARVLDIGCGTGRLTRRIAERVGPRGVVLGIDPLSERIALASSRASAVRFEVGRAEDLAAFADASFDFVCMSSVLHWVEDKARALAEIRRVLAPGGRFGATTNPHELSAVATVSLVLRPLLQRPPYAGHVDLSALGTGKRCTSTELVQLILDSGLELVELHVTENVSRHENGEAFLDFADASSFGNLLRIVPDELRAHFRADLVAGFERRRGPDGVAVRGWGALLVASR